MFKKESMLMRFGYDQPEIEARLEYVWHEIFEGSNKFYWETSDGLGYVMDTGNDDVRTEGMSYAMMLAVQYGRQDIFKKLWGWTMKNMYMERGHHAHYFAWSVAPDGTPNAEGPAPDGEEYFAMDLFLASRRWGDSEGIYNYSSQARELLHYCIHKGQDEDGEPMWNPDNHLIKFIPETEWTDPSYHLPHFYEVFAQEANEEDRTFWSKAAVASRDYLEQACNPETGLNPEYSDYDGSPHKGERGHWDFFSDAYRTIANIGLDTLWNGMTSQVLCDRAAAQQRFFLTHDRTSVYSVDGKALDGTVLHPVGFLAATAQGSLAAFQSSADKAQENAQKWVRLLWDTPMRVGPRRYYDNFLYAFAVLALSGTYQREW